MVHVGIMMNIAASQSDVVAPKRFFSEGYQNFECGLVMTPLWSGLMHMVGGWSQISWRSQIVHLHHELLPNQCFSEKNAGAKE